MNEKYVNEIWSLHQDNADTRSGMGGYGVAFDLQREYYQKLPEDERREYEQAVLVLCQSNEINKAKLALAICSELADVFPSDWAERVMFLTEKLVEKGLQPTYTNTITYAVLNLIWSFNISSLLPFVKRFREQITGNFKQGVLPYSEWLQLYNQVSRILIKVSPDDFWREFDVFYKDQEMLNLLGEKVTSITFTWASFGGVVYGLDWLSKLTAGYSKFSDRTLKARALSSIEKSSNMTLINHPSEKKSIKGFLEWVKEQLGNAG